jgi:hypothetical protein
MRSGKFREDNKVDMYDSTLILYSVPEKQAPKSRVMYNPQYNFATNPYQSLPKVETGSKLALLAK